MARFGMKLPRTASTTIDVGSIITGVAATARRFKLYDLIIGSDASPADNAFLWEVAKRTAAGTSGSTPTVTPLDTSDTAAATVTPNNNPTASGAGSGTVLGIPLNQRATFRWVAAPGSEIIAPSTSCAGWGIQTTTASAVAVEAYPLIEEF